MNKKIMLFNPILATIILVMTIMLKKYGFFWGIQVWSSPILLVFLVPVIVSMSAYLIVKMCVLEYWKKNILLKCVTIILFLINILLLIYLNNINIYFASPTIGIINYINSIANILPLLLFIFIMRERKGGADEK